MKIAFVVHGRFYAFDLARALLRRGHDVWLYTNYPRCAVARFDFPGERVMSFWMHGVTARCCHALRLNPDRKLHQLFGRWARNVVRTQRWDAVLCFSGVAEELFSSEIVGTRWLMRGSSHIETQAEILQAEEIRAGAPLDLPSDWMIQREQREYALTDGIITLSRFAESTFVAHGLGEKTVAISLGVDAAAFRADTDIIRQRCERINSGAKLRVLCVGTKSFRKGLLDFAAVVEAVGDRFEWKWVGAAEPESRKVLRRLRGRVEMTGALPQSALPDVYAWGDVFIFPTLEDGFAAVLTQAAESGLPIIATTNCGAPDFVREEQTGWILPIRSPDAFIERLNWCEQHRRELAQMVEDIYEQFQPRSWDDVTEEYESLLKSALQTRAANFAQSGVAE
jgi:colanic acid/amylovoran biosynthesis glycosyltransferase